MFVLRSMELLVFCPSNTLLEVNIELLVFLCSIMSSHAEHNSHVCGSMSDWVVFITGSPSA
jgi:hypothetical protein